MQDKKTLIITEAEDGKLTGYQSDKEGKGKYRKIFEAQPKNLFYILLGYGKGEYFNVRILGLEDSRRFMEEQEEPVLIWRRNVQSFMSFGKGPERIGIWVLPVDIKEGRYGIEKVELHKGFRAIVIRHGKAAGVYELESGGLIGDTVEQVNDDIDACEDIELMKKQVADCAKERNSGVCNVSLEDFGINLQYNSRKDKENE